MSATSRGAPTPSVPPSERFDIWSRRVIAADRAEVFAFLTDLENHWLIADRFVDVVDLEGPPGARTGGCVRIRGPFGVHRSARTRVDYAAPPEEMGGSARIGHATAAHVRWLLEPAGGATAVTLGATVEHAGTLDRLLLGLGGLAGMRRRFDNTLRALDARVAACAT